MLNRPGRVGFRQGDGHGDYGGGGGGGGLGGLGGGGFGGFAMRLPSNLRRRLLRSCGVWTKKKWLSFQPGTNLSATPFMQ